MCINGWAFWKVGRVGVLELKRTEGGSSRERGGNSVRVPPPPPPPATCLLSHAWQALQSKCRSQLSAWGSGAWTANWVILIEETMGTKAVTGSLCGGQHSHCFYHPLAAFLFPQVDGLRGLWVKKIKHRFHFAHSPSVGGFNPINQVCLERLAYNWHFFNCFLLKEKKSQNIKLCILMYKSIAFTKFTMFCNHHLYYSKKKHFITYKGSLVLIKQ